MACIASISPCVPQKAARRLFFTVYDDATPPTLVDISNAQEITFQVFTSAEGAAVLINKSLSGATLQRNSAHQFNVLITATDSDQPAALYPCEAWITNSDGETYPVAQGFLEIEKTQKGDV